MSKGKGFPPRRKIPAAGVYYKGPTMAWRIFGQLGEDELEFISAAEHFHLLAEARAEALQRCLQFAASRNYSREDIEESIRVEIVAAKASEGASE